MKIAAAKMLQSFKFVATDATKLELFTGDLFMVGCPEIKIKVDERKTNEDSQHVIRRYRPGLLY